MAKKQTDVVVVGCGNAALCAALAAAEQGAHVRVLERAPLEESGGNSRFTAGGFRFAYEGAKDILKVVPDLTKQEQEKTDFGVYPQEQYFDDMFRLTDFRCDADLVEVLVKNSLETMIWLRNCGVGFLPMYGRQAFESEGRFRFWGGLTLEANGGGEGLVEGLIRKGKEKGIEFIYGARVSELLRTGRHVHGVRLYLNGEIMDVHANTVILACGGFEANPEWRTRYLGHNWDLVKVRGTRFNTGDGIRMALEIGAASYGNWSGCHAVGWDLNAPEFGDLRVGDQYQKHSYPLGIMVNAQGKRFVDEGADFRNYTYARYGHEILKQPGQFAWQIFDAKAVPLLRGEYRIREVTKVSADSLEELVKKLDGVNKEQCLNTVLEFNASVQDEREFDPAVKDGRCTRGINPPKSNWANPIIEPPFEAYAVTCGITFTFGGLRIKPDAQVLDTDLAPIQGLYAAGELVGGLFYHNYPGGAGLMAGSVFGRVAGSSAALYSRRK